ncbi:MAG TPA: Zn-dependent hydrolase, partial [Syntrophomonas sp.]|nr:Zn-dependent hydrolase [Syntrophomonas sp.]
MKRIKQVCSRVYQVGGNGLSNPEDCCVYMVDGGSASAVIDAGAGASAGRILENIANAGFELDAIKYIIVTHG